MIIQVKCNALIPGNILSVFIDKAIALRVPDGYPTTEPFVLKQVDPSQGLLIRPHAIEDMFQKERLPLLKEGGEYIRMDDVEAPLANGYSAIAPAAITLQAKACQWSS